VEVVVRTMISTALNSVLPGSASRASFKDANSCGAIAELSWTLSSAAIIDLAFWFGSTYGGAVVCACARVCARVCVCVCVCVKPKSQPIESERGAKDRERE
jgi:hypothetical protein